MPMKELVLKVRTSGMLQDGVEICPHGLQLVAFRATRLHGRHCSGF